MVGFDSISDMMRSCAEEAVQSARKEYGFDLDYSSASIESLETILSSVSRELNSSDNETIDSAVKRWGGYLGETMRRNIGGSWATIQYPGRPVAVPGIEIEGSQLYPLMKVYRRLTMGEPENVWKFYTMIDQKFLDARQKDQPAN